VHASPGQKAFGPKESLQISIRIHFCLINVRHQNNTLVLPGADVEAISNVIAGKLENVIDTKIVSLLLSSDG
jgi:hypothetical protein